MKSYSQLTLLSSSLLLASFGLQAAVVQMTESVSSVAYQGQQAITEELPSATKSITAIPTIVAIKAVTESSIHVFSKPKSLPVESLKQVEKGQEIKVKNVPEKVEVVVNKITPIILPLPLKITPKVRDVATVPIQPLSALAVTKPAALPTVTHASTPSVPSVMPTVIPVQPVLNISALVTPASHAINEEPSLFSAISDWFSVKPVKPWQKGTLAKKAMKPGGEVPEFDVFSEKVFAYKQGSIGGNGVGGGGCGCN